MDFKWHSNVGKNSEALKSILLFFSSPASPEEHRLPHAERRYSGFFEYHIPTDTWRKRKEDSAVIAAGGGGGGGGGGGASDRASGGGGGGLSSEGNSAVVGGCAGGGTDLRFRSSHSMLFHPVLAPMITVQ